LRTGVALNFSGWRPGADRPDRVLPGGDHPARLDLRVCKHQVVDGTAGHLYTLRRQPVGLARVHSPVDGEPAGCGC
jgi:hypothetical protein